MRAKVALLVCAGLVMGLVPAPRVQAADAATAEARQHYLKGNRYFDVGRWDEAADEYEKGYAIKNDPSFLYNMAQAFRRKGDARRARDLYKNYLIKAPGSPQRADIEERIRVLQKQLDEGEAARGVGPAAAPATLTPAATQPGARPTIETAPAPAYAPAPAAVPTTPAPGQSPYGSAVAPAPPAGPGPSAPPTTYPAATPDGTGGAPSPYGSPAASQGVDPGAAPAASVQAEPEPPATTRPGRGLRISGVVCGVGGVVLVGTGIIFGALARSYSDSVRTGAVFNPDDDKRGKLYETLQWVGYGGGAALVVTGAALYAVGAVTGNRASVAIAPTPLRGGAGLSAGGTF